MTTDNDDLSPSITQLAVDGLRTLILEYADAAGGDLQTIEFLADVREALDTRLWGALTLSK